MIEKINRKTIFSKSKTIAGQISEIQKERYDDVNSCSFEREEEKNEYLSQFDLIHESVNSPESFHSVISFDYSDLETYPKALSRKLATLFSDLNTDYFLVISPFKANLFGDLNTNHLQLKKGYRDLKQILENDYYDEALKIGVQDLGILVPIIFWMQRIDTSSPEFIFFFDEQSRFCFYICNSGKVHTISYKNELFTSGILEKNGWKEVNQCINSLS